MIPNENKEAKNPSLNFVEKWSNLEIALTGQIVESYGIPELDSLKAFSLQTLRFLSEELEPQQLCEATEQFGVFAFSNFLTILGVLGHQEDVADAVQEVAEGQISVIDLVNEWLYQHGLDEVKKICDFLMSSKEDIINDFVVPHYKVGKASHLWLEELTEAALKRAIERHFDFVNGYHEVFDFVNYGLFTDADHVSIFEYVLDGQDRQNRELAIKDLLLDAPCRPNTFGEEIHETVLDYVKNLTTEKISSLRLEWEEEATEHLNEVFGKSHPWWVGLYDYGFVWVLSKKASIPKKVVKCYRKIANKTFHAWATGNY